MTIATLTRQSYRRRESVRQPLRAAEFFAGIGLVRLALEKHGWDVVFLRKLQRNVEYTRHHMHVLVAVDVIGHYAEGKRPFYLRAKLGLDFALFYPA